MHSQLYPGWELWLPSSAITGIEGTDSRLRTTLDAQACRSASAGFFNAVTSATEAQFVLPIPVGAVLSECALYEMAIVVNAEAEVEILFSDEDRIDVTGRRCQPWFKTGWDPDLALGRDAVGLVVAYRKELLVRVGGMRAADAGIGSELYELSLRAGYGTLPTRIRHLPRILCHRHGLSWGACEQDSEAGRRIVRTFLCDRGEEVRVAPAPLTPQWNKLGYSLPSPAPLVSVIVPTRKGGEMLARCAEGVLQRTGYPRIELLIADNTSAAGETETLVEALSGDRRVRVIPFPGSFNFAAINNHAAREARGNVLVLLNDDTEVISRDWLTELVSHAVRPGVGAVGAKLIYPDGRLQHAGMVLGPGTFMNHQFRFADRYDPGPNGECALTRTIWAVTGACLAVQRAVFFEVGGMNEADFAVAFSDVDFCMRLGDYGYRVVWTPFAELIHVEGGTRGYDDTPEKVAIAEREQRAFRALWGTLLDADPYRNPNLVQGWEHLSLAAPPCQARAETMEIARLSCSAPGSAPSGCA